MAALTSKWPAIRTISCYIHLKRNMRRHKHLLISNDNYDKVKGDIERMWLARTWHQFQIISTTYMWTWSTKLGEVTFSQWFSEIYLTPAWDLSFSTASGCPGVVAHQQHIESHHKGISKLFLEND
ncbi:hypothetical protein H257_14639 [Aphanomyces astaci]|uniref:MULE transposase domain-containing protein n=1 Tax=Aphanomyces astaci TaxID=112090 RepID=W4FSJ6_APHAT|nr:hypothetical protein H257_14639 [Aphanomyces astaci]ETV69819.1 hypothetical protein H257_14639 [Aphanomyces astaci]|eukprot:XP_009840833.1 hypothetical protein H257_14639 [Aphanomyces astaci]